MLPNVRGFFGVHSASPYSRIDGSFYGTLKSLASASLNFSGKTVPLNGGSLRSPFAVEDGAIAAELDLKTNEYPDFIFTLFMGMTPTDNSADALGAVTALTNKQGTSCMSATTGIASVGVITGSEGDLKFMKCVVIVKSATTVNVYGSTDADFQRGTPETFQDGTLKLLATNVSITSGAASNLAGWGIVLTGGSGSIALVTGDTATFSVRPKNSGSVTGVLGMSGSTFPEFGCLIMAQKRSTGELFEVDAWRCKGEGFPIGLDEKKWSQASIKVQLMYDATLDGFASIRLVTPLTPN